MTNKGAETMIKNQVHSKFKVFIPEAGLSDEEAMRRLGSMVEGWARASKAAIKSVGIEYIDASKQVVLSLGYRDAEDEPGYPVKLTALPLGKLGYRPDEISAAMEKAAAGVENVICHEFFVDDKGEFVMVLLSHG
jgi:hypothetical protein